MSLVSTNSNYYLKYQNKRADYVTQWWKVVNWNEVSRRYAAALR